MAVTDKFTKARTRMITGQGSLKFYASFILQFQFKPMNEAVRAQFEASGAQPTMAVSAVTKELWYAPEFIDEIDADFLVGALCHEAEHVIRMTTARCGERDHMLFNLAHDALINQALAQDDNVPSDEVTAFGVTLPKLVEMEALDPGEEMRDWTAEELYARLQQSCDSGGQNGGSSGEGDEQEGGAGSGGEDDGQGSMRERLEGMSHGDALDGGGDDVTAQQLAMQVANMVQQASAVAEAMEPGSTPGSARLLLEDVADAKVPWTERLTQMMEQIIADGDWSYEHPDRRALLWDQILPTEYDDRVGSVVIALDTSGSVAYSPDVLKDLVSEMVGLFQQVSPREAIVIYADAEVQAVERYDDPADDFRIEHMKMSGGGGTSFDPPFKWLADERVEDVDVVVYLTDGYGGVKASSDPGVPTLWVTPEENGDFHPPFGEVITL